MINVFVENVRENKRCAWEKQRGNALCKLAPVSLTKNALDWSAPMIVRASSTLIVIPRCVTVTVARFIEVRFVHRSRKLSGYIIEVDTSK